MGRTSTGTQEMSASCCRQDGKFDGMSRAFKRALWAVIAINSGMFVVEMTAGEIAGSQALQADALDFLGDTLTYGISLSVIGMSLRIRSAAALFKGVSLAGMGFGILGGTIYRVLIMGVPNAPVMGAVGLLALGANLASVLVLMRYRDGDANVRSIWLCSRNDAIGNLLVMMAAGGVLLTGAALPDLIVAGLMTGLFLWSSIRIVAQALKEFGFGAVRP
jgi:Co/Zn/Cd efflux system component